MSGQLLLMTAIGVALAAAGAFVLLCGARGSRERQRYGSRIGGVMLLVLGLTLITFALSYISI